MPFNLKHLKAGLIYFFFALIVLRGLLFIPGTIGHNWDWTIPVLPSYLKNLFHFSFYTWNPASLGEPNSLRFSTQPAFTFIGTLGYLGLDGAFISKLFPLFTILLSGIFMFQLLEDILASDGRKSVTVSAFLGGFFYAFSPFLMFEIMTGAWLEYLSQAFLPLIILFFRKAASPDNSTLPYLVAAAFFSSLITVSLHTLIYVYLILGLYSLFHVQRKTFIKNLVILGVLNFLFSLWWILPTFSQLKSVMGTAASQDVLSLDTLKYSVPSILEVFTQTGYARPFFKQMLSPDLRIIWITVTFSAVGFIFYQNLRAPDNREGLFWLGFFLFSSVFATAGTPPLGDMVLWLYKNVFIMRLFRSAQIISALTTFSMAILVSMAIALFLQKRTMPLTDQWKAYLCSLFGLAILVIWFNPFFLQGDLGMDKLKKRNQNRDHVDVFRLSEHFQKVLNHINQNDREFRVLFLPSVASPEYLETAYQSSAHGVDPQVYYSPHSAVFADLLADGSSREFVRTLEKKFTDMVEPDVMTKILDLTNTKYIALRKDVLPVYSYAKDKWDVEKTKEYLLKFKGLKTLYESPDVDLFELSDYLPRIYAAPITVMINGNPDDLTQIAKTSSFGNFPALVFTAQQPKKVPGTLESKNRLVNSRILINNSALLNQTYSESQKFSFSQKNEYRIKARISPRTRFLPLNEKIEIPLYNWLNSKKSPINKFADWEISGVNTSIKQSFTANGTQITVSPDEGQNKTAKVLLSKSFSDLNLSETPYAALSYRLQYPLAQTIALKLNIYKGKNNRKDTNVFTINISPSVTSSIQKETFWIDISGMANHYFAQKFGRNKQGDLFLTKVEIVAGRNIAVDLPEIKKYSFSIHDFFLSAKRPLMLKNPELPLFNIYDYYFDSDNNFKQADSFGQIPPEVQTLYKSFINPFIDLQVSPSLKMIFDSPADFSLAPEFVQVEFGLDFDGDNQVDETVKNKLISLAVSGNKRMVYLPALKQAEATFPNHHGYHLLTVHIFSEDEQEIIGTHKAFSYEMRKYQKSFFPVDAFLGLPVMRIDNKLYKFPDDYLGYKEGERIQLEWDPVSLPEGEHNLFISENNAFKVESIEISPHAPVITSPPEIKFTKINPTRYFVEVTKAQNPFTLVFSESFHEGWKAYLRPSSKKREHSWSALWSAWKEKDLRKEIEDHFIVNGYANGWMVPVDQKSKRGNFEIILEYKPQRLFEIGLSASVISLFGAIAFVAYKRPQRRQD